MNMKCPKCKGLMVEEHCVDHFMIWFDRRCLCCGNIVNISTRRIKATAMRPAAARKTYKEGVLTR
jgi:hypothetical protein